MGQINEAEPGLTQDFLDPVATDATWLWRVFGAFLPSGFVNGPVLMVHEAHSGWFSFAVENSNRIKA
jgi:hypothetical protein